jgi:hypothetical protein
MSGGSHSIPVSNLKMASDKALAIVKPADETSPAVSGPVRLPGVYGGLVAHCLARDGRRTTVAFASVQRGDGTTSVVRRVAADIERSGTLRCSVMTAADVAVPERKGLPRPSAAGSGPLPRGPEPELDVELTLVDGGAVASGEILGIASRVDAVVLVVRAGKTRRRELRRAIAAVAGAGGRVVGVVLNRHTPALPEWLERLLG